MVNMGELFANRRLNNTLMDLVPFNHEAESRFLLYPGDLLFARQSLVLEGAGKCVLFQHDAEHVTFESHITRVRLNHERVMPEYVFYFFESQLGKNTISRIVEQGAGAAGIRGSQLETLPIPLPPLAEQQRIADILGTLDDKIELNRRQNATLEALARALFTAWFVDFEPVRAKAEGRWRQGESLPGMPAELWELFPDSFVDSALGPIPAGWGVGEVGDLLILQRGFDLPNSQRSIGQYQVIAASGPNGTHDKKMVDGPGVITGRSGVIGKVYFTFDDFWPLNTALWVKEFRRALPGYGYELLSRMDLSQYNAGSAVPTLNRNQVHSVPAVLPNERLIAIYETHFTLCQKTLKRNQLDTEVFSHTRDELLNEFFLIKY